MQYSSVCSNFALNLKKKYQFKIFYNNEMMKKYLVMAAAAVAVSAFVSCSKDKDLYDPSKTTEQFLKTYQDAFVRVFGQPSADQSWGFGAPATSRMTRSANPNGNMWCQTYDVPYALTDNQKDIVRKYYQQVRDPQDEGFNYTNFFVQDVYKGGTKVTDGSKTTEAYYAAYGDPNQPFFGSNQMDRLTSAGANGQGNEHISNYNNAQCSSRSDIKHTGDYRDDYTPGDNQTENFNGLRTYTDKIMLMENCSTSYFGYQNSLQSSYTYNDMFKRVSGNTIMAWARQNNITVPADGDVSGMHFVGFDYEADLSHNLTDIYQGNSYLVTEVEAGTAGAFMIPNKQGDNDWQKGKWFIAGARDHYYSDWIIRVVDGNGDEQPLPSLRVIAEDLSAVEDGDFDFNDVVFDAQYVNANQVDVTIWAAGGTLPLMVYGQEVHNLFKIANPNALTDQGGEINTQTMINTKAKRINPKDPYSSAELENKPVFSITDRTWSNNPDTFAEQVRDYIKVIVTKTDDKGESKNLELTADKGKTPGKVAVATDYQWCDEKVYIGNEFKKFVRNPYYAMWWRE